MEKEYIYIIRTFTAYPSGHITTMTDLYFFLDFESASNYVKLLADANRVTPYRESKEENGAFESTGFSVTSSTGVKTFYTLDRHEVTR